MAETGTSDLPLIMANMHHPIKLRVQYYKEAIRSRKDDVVVISYPKSGRTWHRAALGHYLSTLVGHDPAQALDTRELTRQHGLPVISYTHNGANFLSAIGPEHYLNGSRSIWKGRKVILLLREPQDVIVSSYFHARDRSKCFQGSLGEFVRHPFTGIHKWLAAHQRWKSYFLDAKDVLVQTYEGMHQNHGGALKKVVAFMGLGAANDAAIAQAVEFSSFGNMNRLEGTNYFRHKSMRSEAEAANSGMKVRIGKTGSYREQMSDADLVYVQDAIGESGNPFSKEISNCVY